MKTCLFEGSGVAIVTPFHEDFSVDYDSLRRIIDWQIDEGTDCIVICGTTGEATTLSDEEHVECIRVAVEQTAGRVPVVAGCGSNDTAYAVWLSQEAKKCGADGLLHVTPYYNKTTQAGLVRHFTTIADATDLPVILYNVPSRTGMSITPETYLELSKHPNIVGTKEASGDISAIAKTAMLCGDDFSIYSGNDDQAVALMSLGGKGVISVLANIMPRQTHEMCRHFLDGRAADAAKMQKCLLSLTESLFLEVNPIPVKEAMNLMGLKVGPCRLPLIEMSEKPKAAMLAEMKKHGLVG